MRFSLYVSQPAAGYGCRCFSTVMHMPGNVSSCTFYHPTHLMEHLLLPPRVSHSSDVALGLGQRQQELNRLHGQLRIAAAAVAAPCWGNDPHHGAADRPLRTRGHRGGRCFSTESAA